VGNSYVPTYPSMVEAVNQDLVTIPTPCEITKSNMILLQIQLPIQETNSQYFSVTVKKN
jgi:hypothetical protein